MRVKLESLVASLPLSASEPDSDAFSVSDELVSPLELDSERSELTLDGLLA